MDFFQENIPHLIHTLPQLILYSLVAIILLMVAVTDARTKEIPDVFNAAIFVCGIIAIWVIPGISLLSRGIGVFVISVPLLLITMLITDAFGGGDIKMMAASGFLLGWQNAITAACIGIMLGGLWGSMLLILKQKNGKDYFAFGPCLAIGVFTSLLWGDSITDWYISHNSGWG